MGVLFWWSLLYRAKKYSRKWALSSFLSASSSQSWLMLRDVQKMKCVLTSKVNASPKENSLQMPLLSKAREMERLYGATEMKSVCVIEKRHVLCLRLTSMVLQTLRTLMGLVPGNSAEEHAGPRTDARPGPGPGMREDVS